MTVTTRKEILRSAKQFNDTLTVTKDKIIRHTQTDIIITYTIKEEIVIDIKVAYGK